MKKFRIGGALAIVAATALAFAGFQDYNLKHPAKEGEVFKYKMTGELSVMGQSVQMSAIMTNKTTKVGTDGNYVVESKMSEAKIVLNGSEMDLGDQPGSTTTYKPDGTVVDVQGESVEAGGARMANLTSFIISEKPVKVGDSWTSEVKGDSKKNTVDVSGKYTLEAIEKLDSGEAAKVSFESKEKAGDTPATISGTAWIDVKSGNPVKVENTWKNVPIPGAPGPVDGKMTMTLIP
jgi:hypothetical protein